MVTKLPVTVGQQLKPGQLLLEISGRPVFILRGKLPVYRDLKPGAEGDDVAQLQSALRELHFDVAGDRRGTFGAGTKSALSGFYRSIGYDPLPAQADESSAVRDAEEAVTAAERNAEDAQSALEESNAPKSPSPTSSPTERETASADTKEKSPASSGGTAGADLRKQVSRAREDLKKAQEQLDRARTEAGPMLPANEVVFVSSFPARVEKVNTRVGSKISGSVLTVSAGQLMITSYLQEPEKGLVRPGQHVEILSELTGTAASGKVLSVANSITQDAPSSDGSETSDQQEEANGYLMLIKPEENLPTQLAGQDVRLTIRAASTRGKSLIVPVSAISAGADGRTSVTLLEEDGKRRRVPVVTGTNGDGYVEIHPSVGARLVNGDRVVTGVQAGTAMAGRSK
ncbi:hypothetical protein ACIBUY_28100 [Streptomyces sp. NPDC050085]|uniref:hypothetical protein n=1 Tax=Streptomyces sp. NPDC050085 TaxID=3365600 RepID=UPI0037AEC6F8